jgi:hypothetical protein
MGVAERRWEREGEREREGKREGKGGSMARLTFQTVDSIQLKLFEGDLFDRREVVELKFVLVFVVVPRCIRTSAVLLFLFTPKPATKR